MKGTGEVEVGRGEPLPRGGGARGSRRAALAVAALAVAALAVVAVATWRAVEGGPTADSKAASS